MNIGILGPSGLRVSQLCLGTATFGNRAWGCDEAEARLILDQFLEAGGNFIDTANKYADGASEEILGRLLKGRRDQVVLATKYTAIMDARDLNSSGNHRKSLVRSLEASLRRLATEFVDILWVHAWDGVTPIEELMRALDDQVRAGKVGSVGISNAPAWMIASANTAATLRGWSPFVAVQNEYNLLQRGAEREVLPMTQFFGLSFLAWAPIAQGRLTGKYSKPDRGNRRLSPEEARLPPGRERIVAETFAAADSMGCPPSLIAIRWIMQRQPEVIPIIGARDSAQFRENLGCLDVQLPAAQMERLTSASAIDPESPSAFMRGTGRDFMWGKAGGVPLRPATARQPWWQLST